MISLAKRIHFIVLSFFPAVIAMPVSLIFCSFFFVFMPILFLKLTAMSVSSIFYGLSFFLFFKPYIDVPISSICYSSISFSSLSLFFSQCK